MAKKLNVVFVCGPRQSGKSTLIQSIVPQLCAAPPHYLRLVPVDDEQPRLTLLGDLKTAGLASWRRINYDAERIFEFLPECLTEIAEMDVSRTVLIEADADPGLRYAFPYDHRIFVMPAPVRVFDVFRTPEEAAIALRGVMDDTAAFASEIFGMFDPDADEDDPVTRVHYIGERGAVTEERVEITPIQMRRFVNSPLGAEIASRIQLQPEYHSLVESDVIIVNMAIGGTTSIVDQCIRQIQTLMSRLEHGRLNKPVLFNCDPLDPADPLQQQMLLKLRDILADQ
ncbi:MAG: hypothetical protein IID34_12395 [Planctomycetes bacterium]|nr:hypothetical protein [Planctomycetota bacterium]